jgi:hypothetical protein
MRPTFDDFMRQVDGLSSEQGRALAEITRVPDWRRDRDIGNLIPILSGDGAGMGYGAIADENAARTASAVEEVRRIVGRDAADVGKQQALEALAGRRLSWPGMRRHRPVRIAMWALLGVAAAVYVLNRESSDPLVLGAFFLVLGLAGAAALGGYLLPPDEGDLRDVVEHSALAHIAGPSLAEEHFDQLAGGWYAVLEGRWQRGRRPYFAWGCLLVSIVAIVLLGVVLNVTGAGR